MAFCRLVFPLLVLSVICVSTSNVPVFLFNGPIPKNSIKSNPMTTVSTLEFEGILKEELADNPLTIVFIEKTLSVEDFSLKTAEGETAFPFLHDHLKSSLYLPSVHNPLLAINDVADPSESDHIKLTENALSEEISTKADDGAKFVFISLNDAIEGESRSAMLLRHDGIMQETLKNLDSNVVAIYTAHYPSWTIPDTHSRVRRDVTSRNDQRTYVADGIRLYVDEINIVTGNDSFVLTGFTEATTEYGNSSLGLAQNMSTKMSFSNASLTLNFNNKGGYWFFSTVKLELPSISIVDELFSMDEVFAILGFSYRCKETIRFTGINDTHAYPYSVIFKDMKIQPFFETTNVTQGFGDSFNCVGFFSAPIWAALFVVFILLLITFYGIMMMLDIRTMDRFDDPKGKTITINTAE